MDIKTQSTVEPIEKLSLEEWLAEFRIGLMAPKPKDGIEKAKRMMEDYDFKKLQVQSDSNYVIAF